MSGKLSLTFLIIAITAAPAFADQLTLGVCNGGSPVVVTSGPATLNCTINFNNNPAASIQTGSTLETGNLDLGTFGLTANVTNTPVGSLGGGAVSSDVEVNYVIGSSLSNGTAQIKVNVDGTFSSSGGGIGFLEFEYGGGPWTVNGVSITGSSTDLGAGPSTLLLDAPIVNGTVDLGFTALADVICNGAPTPCSSTADFDDPISITGASAFDANGDPVAATFISESGFNPNAVASTPEPTSLALLGIGLVALAATAWHRRRAQGKGWDRRR